MNKTAIESFDYSWNPAIGCTKTPRCFYCYAEPITARFGARYPNGFNPTFFPDRLIQPLIEKKGGRVFTCSMGDLFCEGMNLEWVKQIFDIMLVAQHHTFFVSTKHPDRLKSVLDHACKTPLPNVLLGVTVENQEAMHRLEELREGAPGWRKYVAFEPLIGPITFCKLDGIEWGFIGAMTGRFRKKYPPDPRWIEMLVNIINKNDIPVFMKDSIEDLCKGKRIPFVQMYENREIRGERS